MTWIVEIRKERHGRKPILIRHKFETRQEADNYQADVSGYSEVYELSRTDKKIN